MHSRFPELPATMRFEILFLALFLQHTLRIVAFSYPDEASSIVAIGQTIELFGILVDSAQYNQMDRVFTANTSVDFDLPGVGVLHGLAAVEKETAITSNVTSQHSLTTRRVDLTGPKSANATAYVIGTYFGRGAQAGQVFTVYGT